MTILDFIFWKGQDPAGQHRAVMTRVTEHAEYFSKQVTSTRRFFHPDWKHQPRPGHRFAIVGGGCEWCSPDFVMNRRRLPFVAFEFVWRGRGSVTLGGKQHDLTSGHAFFFDHTIPHTIRTSSREPMVKYFFNFTGTQIRALLRTLGLRPGTVIRVSDPAHVVALLEEAVDHSLKGAPLGDHAAAITLEHALVLCAEGRMPESTRLEPSRSTYLRCRDYLLRHYPELANVTEAASRCGVDPAYMTRLFARFGNETPHECLQRLKISQAGIKLRQAGALVKQVAAELGYKSAAHFSRVFKKVNGTAPLLFRLSQPR
jgi:AraC family transcriptional regulator, arabinose operon regulatory protein